MRLRQPLASIIVNNYNYARFLRPAIDSALSQSYPQLEVIVVDDGSTDESRAIIASYGDAIAPALKANGGQASALNAGFAHSHGEIVVFLDADDILLPDTVQRVMQVFQRNPALARVQYRLQVIDTAGAATGALVPPPYLPLPHGDMRGDLPKLVNSANWSPTSGNAFAAWTLRHILPMPEADFRVGADYYLSRVNALCGPLHALDEVGAYYRAHDENHYFQAQLNLARIRQHVSLTRRAYPHLKRFVEAAGYSQALAMALDEADEIYLAQRMVSLKCEPVRHPIEEDTLRGLGRRGVRAALCRPTLSPPVRLLHALWFLAMVVAPRAAANPLAAQLLPESRSSLNAVIGVLQRQRRSNPQGQLTPLIDPSA